MRPVHIARRFLVIAAGVIFLFVVMAAPIAYTRSAQELTSLALSGGTVTPYQGADRSQSRYGPFNGNPALGTPRHAYSPFERSQEPATPCPGGECPFVPGQLLVKLEPTLEVADGRPEGGWSDDEALNQALEAAGVQAVSRLLPTAQKPPPGAFVESPLGERLPLPDLTRWLLVTLPEEADVHAAGEVLAAAPGVAAVEPNYTRQAARIDGPAVDGPTLLSIPGPTTDPLYNQQWHLPATNVPAAWQWLEDHGYSPGGDPDIVVAVIDSGIDYNHPDLAANMWINAPEFGGTPGLDDDGNGFVDDIHGVNVVSNQHSGNPMDDHGHGTHVAGIIGAQGQNNEGGVGVAYNVQLMGIKAAQYSGVLASSDIAEAVYYAVEKGADIINMSFGGYARSQLEEDALAVAFGTSVLVAAAGNDGYPNELPCLPPRPMYPAAHNWVLGVMASTGGGARASFSNYDCVPHTSYEYELMAPGVDVWSTLPADAYAAWDGTSMSAPVVSGIAALVRTVWSDSAVYSSRFIMGQIAANAAPVADAYATLTIPPEPELTYLEHWLFDTADQDPGNDEDGIVDAGETVDLAIVIRNHWGKADPVTVTLAAQAEGSPFLDPYVTMISDTVSYGAIGSFNWDDNGLIYDGQGEIIGVEYPFRFSVPITTPNDHVIPFLLTMEAGNGYNPADPNAPYTFEARFNLIVQRGTELPRIIDSDMVLTKDYYWLVPDSTLIEDGVTVTVTEGAQLQFWSGDPADPFNGNPDPYLQVEGSLRAHGSDSEPVEMFQWPLFPNLATRLFTAGDGEIDLAYTRVVNPRLGGTNLDKITIDHSTFEVATTGFNSDLFFGSMSHSSVKGLDGDGGWKEESSQIHTNLLEAMISPALNVDAGTGNVFLHEQGSSNAPGYKLYGPAFLRSIFPSDWGGHTYVALSPRRGTEELLSFDDAAGFAGEFGGHLVDVNGSAENSFLGDYRIANLNMAEFIANYGTMDCGQLSCWEMFYSDPIIGLTDREIEGTFVWQSGQPLTYTHWAVGYPLGVGDFARLDPGGNPFWKDSPLSDNRPFLLELPGSWSQLAVDAVRETYVDSGDFNGFYNNAILNRLWDPNVDNWHRLVFPWMQDTRNWVILVNHNYWGTTSQTLIEKMLVDYEDDFNLGRFKYEPFLSEPPAAAYPFVANVVLSTSTLSDTTVVGAEPVTFTVTFNRDMDMAVQPAVSFGPDAPVTDYTVFGVDGGWTDPRTWQGNFTVTPATGDGYQLIRVAGAVAADDPWLVTGDDAGRFRFEVITSGSSAMNLQAVGGEGYIDLSWIQNDFDLLAGYNLYRSTLPGSGFTRLNSALIPASQTSFQDTNVVPGQPYYYYFTVVETSMVESGQSNTATATPIDTIEPIIEHTPVSEAPPGLPLTLFADVTDNVAVAAVTLYYRDIGAALYLSRAMVHTTGDRYSATLQGSLVTAPGLEYYLTAEDGINTVFAGRPENPYVVAVVDQPFVTGVTPGSGPAAGGDTVTVSGSNFQPGASLTFGGAPAGDVTFINSGQITGTTPAHFPAAVDVTVTNPDSQSGTLLGGYTYLSDAASVGLPDTVAGQFATIDVPLNAADVNGLVAADVTVTFDNAVVHGLGASTGNLTAGWSLAVNTTTPGEIQVSMASPGGPVSGSGILLYLELDVVGTPGTSTTLHIDDLLLNDGAIPANLTDGSLTVAPVYDISGAVDFWNSGVLSNTLLTLSGPRTFTTTSDATGAYSLADIPSGDYTLTPEKLDEANEITAYDASLTLQHAAGLISLSGYQATAADVNNNSTINSFDAYYILQKAVDLLALPFPGAGVVWRFDPESRTYVALGSDQVNQDFTGVLIGDVSGNWMPGGAPLGGPADSPPESGEATLTLPEVAVLAGEAVTVSLDLTLSGAQLFGADIGINYDPSIATATAVALGAISGDWSLAGNLDSPGQILIGMAGANPIVSGGELLRIGFVASGVPGASTPLTLTYGSLNEGAIAETLVGGAITLGITVGDVSCDNSRNVIDALYIMQLEVGLRSPVNSCPLQPETLNVTVCDVSSDASCNVIDALLIMQCDVGIANPLCPTSGPSDQDHRLPGRMWGKRSFDDPPALAAWSDDRSDLGAPSTNVMVGKSSSVGQVPGVTLFLVVAFQVMRRSGMWRSFE